MTIRNARLLYLVLVVVFVSLACNMPGASEVSRPPTSVPMTTEEVQQFENQIQETLASPNESGEVTVVFTEQQLNGYLVARMAESPEQVIQNPVLKLTDGKMEVYGQVSQSSIQADVVISLIPYVDAEGNPRLDVVSINMGPIPVPDALVNQVEGQVDTLLDDAIASSEESFTVRTITVTEGQLTVVGQRQ